MAECELLSKGLSELLKRDSLMYARLVKAIHRRDQAMRRANLQAACPPARMLFKPQGVAI